MLKILLLEDDPIIYEILIEFLSSNNYSITHAFDMQEAKELIFANQYDIFLFDVNLPDGNSFELLRELKKFHITTPTLYITALQGIEDLKKGFLSGCDDYLKKPFELEELKLRLENIQRLYNLNSHMLIENNIHLDTEKLTLFIGELEYKISNKEVAILKYLVTNKTRFVSIDELIHNIWSYEENPSEATIRTYIKNLRKILGENKIQNIRGVGYRFIKE